MLRNSLMIKLMRKGFEIERKIRENCNQTIKPVVLDDPFDIVVARHYDLQYKVVERVDGFTLDLVTKRNHYPVNGNEINLEINKFAQFSNDFLLTLRKFPTNPPSVRWNCTSLTMSFHSLGCRR